MRLAWNARPAHRAPSSVCLAVPPPPPPGLIFALICKCLRADLTNCFYEFGVSFSLLGHAESDALGGALARFGSVAEKVALLTNALVRKPPPPPLSPPPVSLCFIVDVFFLFWDHVSRCAQARDWFGFVSFA